MNEYSGQQSGEIVLGAQEKTFLGVSPFDGRFRMSDRFRRGVGFVVLTLLATITGATGEPAATELPWRDAGLDVHQAAAHLLDRFAFGPRPGDVEAVVALGLEEWLELQLSGQIADAAFEGRLATLDSWSMSYREIAEVYPNPGQLLQAAIAAGVVESPQGAAQGGDPRQQRMELMSWAESQGYRAQRELMADLVSQKIWRAVESERQLVAVMADFWFNHFNVSLTDNQARGAVLSYERDAILPGVLGRFSDLLIETATHPAMLFYLDNAQSTAEAGDRTTASTRMGFNGRPPQGGRFGTRGLNENYARELLELHTLGVEGGYSQQDVIEVARAFTGWTAVPRGPGSERFEARVAQLGTTGGRLGFVIDGEFLFRADAHDAGKKKVLGHKLKSGRGVEDGVQVLEIVGSHPSTARHLATKLAVRFVSDEPPSILIDRLASTFASSSGNIAEVLRTLAWSPEFWAPTSTRQKIKSPLELAASAARAMDAVVVDPLPLASWISRMGQPLYSYQAPTGFPDRGSAWVNTGSLMSRMNFGLHLATGRVLGVEADLAGLNGDLEPATLEEALAVYASLLMPARNVTETVGLLDPLVRDSGVVDRLAARDPSTAAGSDWRRGGAGMLGGDFEPLDPMMWGDRSEIVDRQRRQAALNRERPSALEQVVGLILGSPQFQRR